MSQSGQSQLEGKYQNDRAFDHRVTNCAFPTASCFQHIQCFDYTSVADKLVNKLPKITNKFGEIMF